MPIFMVRMDLWEKVCDSYREQPLLLRSCLLDVAAEEGEVLHQRRAMVHRISLLYQEKP